MARPIVLSNGQLHVGLNIYGEVHDFYYPYVGLDNHAASKNLRHRIGVYVDGRISWVDDGSWHFVFRYHKNTLIGRTKAHNDAIGVTLEFDDCVDVDQNVFFRNIHIINNADRHREIKLFMHQVFDISDSSGNGDTIQYLPGSRALLTYRGHRAFVIGGEHSDGGPFDQHSVGLFGIEGRAGTYMDAEDGFLANNGVEHGRVDSTLGFTANIAPHSSHRVYYWVAAGLSTREAIDLHDLVRESKSPLNRLLATSRWWHNWIAPAEKFAEKLDEEYRDSFIRSILLVKSHIDERGAVIASTDTTMLHHARDAYAYCWPRDGAYAVWPLIRLGYTQEPEAFFAFCRQTIHPKGYLMHKFEADGSLGASWHGYEHDGVVAAPIQEDETALTLFVFAQYYQIHKNDALLKYYYPDFVQPMAEFLASYINKTTGLPEATYDLWEEHFLTTTYTTSVTYAALIAAADLADAFSDSESAVRWRTAAEDIALSAHKHLYNKDRKVFYKGLLVKTDGTIIKNDTVDASAVFGAFMYGLFDFDSEEIKNSMLVMKETLKMPQVDVLGLARYENDNYSRVSNEITGNPWFITTLWLAQYHLELGNKNEAERIIRWCQKSMATSGILSEQINPFNGHFVSVAPLTWSHAELANTLLDFVDPS